jgi:hypothetical protein
MVGCRADGQESSGLVLILGAWHTRLLARRREAGAEQQVTAVAGRLPEAGLFELFREQEDRQDRFRFGGRADGEMTVFAQPPVQLSGELAMQPGDL